MRIEFEFVDDYYYYKDLKSWYPSVHLDFEHYLTAQRSLRAYFGRFKLALEWSVDPSNYPFNKREELYDKYCHDWYFMDAVDWFTGRDRVKEAEERYAELYGECSVE